MNKNFPEGTGDISPNSGITSEKSRTNPVVISVPEHLRWTGLTLFLTIKNGASVDPTCFSFYDIFQKRIQNNILNDRNFLVLHFGTPIWTNVQKVVPLSNHRSDVDNFILDSREGTSNVLDIGMVLGRRNYFRDF